MASSGYTYWGRPDVVDRQSWWSISATECIIMVDPWLMIQWSNDHPISQQTPWRQVMVTNARRHTRYFFLNCCCSLESFRSVVQKTDHLWTICVLDRWLSPWYGCDLVGPSPPCTDNLHHESFLPTSYARDATLGAIGTHSFPKHYITRPNSQRGFLRGINHSSP